MLHDRCPRPTSISSRRLPTGAENSFAPLLYKNDHFYQDRLGTNIGKTPKRDAISAGDAVGTSRW